ncbi:MAG: hypothetical protein MJ229_04525 [bacterium]|nr:hypothetical protein [bacterium]
MNVDTISSATIETSNSVNQKTNVTTEKKDDVKSFKDELAENKKVETAKSEKVANDDKTKLSSKEAVKAVATQNQENNSEIISQKENTNIIINNNAQNININENAVFTQQDNRALSNNEINEKVLFTQQDNRALSNNEKLINNTLSELNEKIMAINTIQTGRISKTNSESDINQLIGINAEMKSLTMNDEDINFFLELTNANQTTTAISGETLAKNMVTFTENAKTEMIQKSVPVSKALIDSLAESMQTNKPFRIDFDKDVAVIMKVDKNGVLSANFIPGNTAVEAYLRNNIGLLRQAFTENNLEYNELSYSRNKNQEQQKQRQNNKENDNE